MIPALGLKEDELSLITQSSQGFVAADTANYESERIANMINGMWLLILNLMTLNSMLTLMTLLAVLLLK